MIRRTLEAFVCIAVLLTAVEAIVAAHSGPPYPIVSNRALGAYRVSIWTDPDTTDNGTPAGQFWIELEPADGRTAIPAGTQATVAIRPLDRAGPAREGRADPVKGNVARQFVALLMDHEGPFGAPDDRRAARPGGRRQPGRRHLRSPAGAWLIALYSSSVRRHRRAVGQGALRMLRGAMTLRRARGPYLTTITSCCVTGTPSRPTALNSYVVVRAGATRRHVNVAAGSTSPMPGSIRAWVASLTA